MGICESCKKQPATFHLTNLTREGQKIEKHLCEQCAVNQGLVQIQKQPYVNEIVENFVKDAKGIASAIGNLVCENCGISYLEFRNQGLLGCADDYEVFKEVLGPLLERAQDGATHHTGKTPCSLDASSATGAARQEIRVLKRQLADAVAAEDYERAAELRDRIESLESA